MNALFDSYSLIAADTSLHTHSAFVDPECYSNFRVEESTNAWSTNVSREDGSTCEGVVYGLRIGEVSIRRFT